MLNIKQIRMALYSLYLTNRYGFKLRAAKSNAAKKALRYQYSKTLLDRLNIEVVATGLENVDPDGQYLLISNHRSIIDPCIIEVAIRDTNILGLWVSKMELYYSPFFGIFVQNAGTILLNRGSKNMSKFFKATKQGLTSGASVFVFPEGTRNKQNTPLGQFKEGSQIIAVKNRLPMLPVYIRTNANEVLHTAINRRQKGLHIEIEFGKVIDYKDRSTGLEQKYREVFGIQQE